MKPCPEFQDALVELASGTLAPALATALQAHLLGCEGCREELAALERALREASLPEPTPEERKVELALSSRILAAAIAQERRRRVLRPTGFGLGLAAALAMAVAAPTLWQRIPHSRFAAGDADVSALAADDPLLAELAPDEVAGEAPAAQDSSEVDDAAALESFALGSNALSDDLGSPDDPAGAAGDSENL